MNWSCYNRSCDNVLCSTEPQRKQNIFLAVPKSSHKSLKNRSKYKNLIRYIPKIEVKSIEILKFLTTKNVIEISLLVVEIFIPKLLHKSKDIEL